MKTTAANLLSMADVALHFDEPMVLVQHRDPWQAMYDEADRLRGVVEQIRYPNGDSLTIYEDGSRHFHDHRFMMKIKETT